MSADNYVMLRKHPDGGFALLHGFVSDDETPTVRDTTLCYDNMEEAIEVYSKSQWESEYGLRIHSECFGPKEHRFTISIWDKTDAPPVQLTIFGNRENGYSIRNYVEELDDGLQYNRVDSELF